LPAGLAGRGSSEIGRIKLTRGERIFEETPRPALLWAGKEILSEYGEKHGLFKQNDKQMSSTSPAVDTRRSEQARHQIVAFTRYGRRVSRKKVV